MTIPNARLLLGGWIGSMVGVAVAATFLHGEILLSAVAGGGFALLGLAIGAMFDAHRR